MTLFVLILGVHVCCLMVGHNVIIKLSSFTTQLYQRHSDYLETCIGDQFTEPVIGLHTLKNSTWGNFAAFL